MKNFLNSRGVEFTGTAKNSGDMHVVSNRVGVVVETVLSTETGVMICEGRFTVPKLSTDVVAIGDRLYYDNAANRVTLTKAALKFAGWASKAAGNGVTTVEMDLSGGAMDT